MAERVEPRKGFRHGRSGRTINFDTTPNTCAIRPISLHALGAHPDSGCCLLLAASRIGAALPILDNMPDPSLPPDATDASWSQLEGIVERLHEAAREGLTPREFYRRLLAETCNVVGAIGGAAWRVGSQEHLEVIVHVTHEDASAREASDRGRLALRRELAQRAISRGVAEFAANDAANTSDATGDQTEWLVVPVLDAATPADGARRSVGAIEFEFSSGCEAAVRRGLIDFSTTLAAVAADFHALAELRGLRATAVLHGRAVDLLRRVQQPRELAGAAFEVANEGRRLIGCDRLSVLLRRGGQWRLASVSGSTRIERQTEFARLSERLAESLANWGEPVGYPGPAGSADLLPPRLAAALEEHLDQSHARQLAGAPIAFGAPDQISELTDRVGAQGPQPAGSSFDFVLLAEGFDAAGAGDWQRQLVEIGELCAPALARAAELDRFPLRTVLGWSDRLAALQHPRQRTRALLALAGALAIVASLAFIPATLTVEAPARLATAIQRDIFATASGAVAEVRVAQGDQVKQGDVLIVLADPELSLKLQQVRGEINATRQRLAAMAITRTDRTLRERGGDDRLPLSAEQRQLEEQLASLDAQRLLLEARRDALTLRSPIDGQVLTPDVQSLLTSRPVERGQSLLTIADASSGWQLLADVPQRDIGAVVEAQRERNDAPEDGGSGAEEANVVAASYRLSGDVDQSYPAHLLSVNAAAPLETEGLEDDAPPVQVRLAIDGEPPAAARPGMAATVRIDCGRRSLGYVWLHDAWATVYRWATF